MIFLEHLSAGTVAADTLYLNQFNKMEVSNLSAVVCVYAGLTLQ